MIKVIEKQAYKLGGGNSVGAVIPAFMGYNPGDYLTMECDTESDTIVIRRGDMNSYEEIEETLAEAY